MTNKEKIKEVFGIDLPETCKCTSEKFDEKCLNKKYLNITGCKSWQNQKYEQPKSDIPMECEDCISRKDMLAVLRQSHSLTQALDGFEKLPSVTPKEKIGHWIGHREHCEKLGVMPSGLGAYKWCSNCDCGIDINEWYINHYNFCPNCGARMVNE